MKITLAKRVAACRPLGTIFVSGALVKGMKAGLICPKALGKRDESLPDLPQSPW